MKMNNKPHIGFLILFGILLCLAYTGEYYRGSVVYIFGRLTICIPVLDLIAILVIPPWRRKCSARPYAHLAVVHIQTLVFWWATGVSGFFLTYPPYPLHPDSMVIIRLVFGDLSILGAQIAIVLCHYTAVRWASKHPLPIPVLPLISLICPLIALLALLVLFPCSGLPA
jgi:hypothetical protein